MALPFFYTEVFSPINNIVQVLRMAEGRQINITDGLGTISTAEIVEAHKKKCKVKIIDTSKQIAPAKKVCIAISPVKNSSRFEWFLEKATEIGVTEIVPLICERTEKQYLKHDRLRGILISAMLQSQQSWLPVLREPVKFEKFVEGHKSNNKYIAHCEEQNKISLKEITGQFSKKIINQSIILIGPEGDFTKHEIDFALQNNFTSVALGNSRLRTETAAMVAATLLCVS